MATLNRRSGFITLVTVAALTALLLIGGVVWAIIASTSNDALPTEEHSTAADAQSPDNNVSYATNQEQKLALNATEIMTTWTPSEDDTQTAAELRARHLMTDEAASRVQEPERSSGGDDWRRARDTNATSRPQVEIAEGTETGYITVLARWQWVEGDGVNSWWPNERRAYHFTFTAEDGHLKIVDYTYETLRR